MECRLPRIGLASEYAAVHSAVRDRTNLVLLGPAGCGKTKVVREALEAAGAPAVYLGRTPVLHQLLVDLACALIHDGHAALRAACAEPSPLWISRQTSVHLKGILWDALAAEPVALVLDHIQDAGGKTYRFLQRLYYAPGMSIVAVARNPRDLGELGRLFWNPNETVTSKPLNERDALRLFDEAARTFGADCVNFDEFRENVVKSAHGNPGKIVEMCRLAASPRYRREGRVLCAVVHLDTIGRFPAR